MRFLLVRLSALGDVVCSLPAAVALRRGYPEAEIVWVVDRRFEGIVRCCRSVDRVVTLDQADSVLGERFDAALDLQGLLKSAMIVGRASATVKVGYHWQREGAALFSQRVLPDPKSIHVVDQYVDVARALGGQMERAEFDLAPLQEDASHMRAKLESRGVEPNRFVALNAGAGWATKRWPPEHFAAFTEGLRERGLAAVFVGGPGPSDREVFDQVVRITDHAKSMLGETSTSELVALISLAQAHVGGDTGSSHIAAALGVPAIGLYSITSPARSCPYGQADRCLYDRRGLAHIGPDRVLDLVDALAARRV